MKLNNKIFISTIIITLMVGLLFGWLIFSNKESAIEEQHEHLEEVAEETTWTCSMHPQIRKKEPGNCPICGMELIPLANAEEGIDAMAVSMSPTAMQLASVTTAEVGEMNPIKVVRLNGKIQEDERLVFSQSSHIPGRIEKLQVNYTGEYVQKGQVLAYVYSPELVTAQEELFEAYKIRESQPALFRSAKEKLRNWKLSGRQIQQVLDAGRAREQFPITADVSGYVIGKSVNLGDYLNKGQAIYEIANLSRVWVLFDVYESDLPWVKKGDKVIFTVKSLPGREFHSQISFIDPVIDPQTRVAQARVEIANEDNQLKPEMFASGEVKASLENKANAIVIPKTAVMWTGTRSVVYVKEPTDKGVSFLMREVTLGPALGESYVVEEGLQKGEEIAVSGTFSIDAAAQLAGKPSMMNPEGGPAMTEHHHGSMNGTSSEDQPATNVQQPVDKIKAGEQVKAALKPVVDQYMATKNALVSDNLEDAKKAAAALKATVEGVKMSLFRGEDHSIWMQHQSALRTGAGSISESKDLEQARIYFITLSDHIVQLAEAFKPLDKTLYVQHCPMADNNKGADWLSMKKDIQNPYLGEAMLTCGEVKTVIK